jgi:hypothetical protein
MKKTELNFILAESVAENLSGAADLTICRRVNHNHYDVWLRIMIGFSKSHQLVNFYLGLP